MSWLHRFTLTAVQTTDCRVEGRSRETSQEAAEWSGQEVMVVGGGRLGWCGWRGEKQLDSRLF